MNRLFVRGHRAQRGVTLIELLVALAVFAMFVIMIDAIFSSARTSARKTEVAADVQQNARVSVDRITREIRESRAAEVRIGTGGTSVVFKSARLESDPTVFCLYVRTTTAPLYNATCFTSVSVTPPPYASPVSPLGSYTPIWQRYVGYFLVYAGGGTYDLHRVVATLTSPGQALPDPATLTGGDVIASYVQSFTVSASGGNVLVTLNAKGVEVVQGRAIPEQDVLLPGQVMTRNN